MKKTIVLLAVLLLSNFMVSAEHVDLSEGLVDYWTMDESSGNLEGHNGNFLIRYGNPVYKSSCVSGGCYVLKGSGNNDDAADSFSTQVPLEQLNGDDDVCVSFWAKLNTNKNEPFWLFTLMHPDKRLAHGLSGQISKEGVAGYDRSNVDENVAQVPEEQQYLTNFTDKGFGKIQHYVFCEQTKEGKFQIYINGKKVIDEESGKDLSTEGSTSIFSLLGNEPDGSFNFGIPDPQLIDEVGIWNRELSKKEIKTLLHEDPFGNKYKENIPGHEVPEFSNLSLIAAAAICIVGVLYFRRQ